MCFTDLTQPIEKRIESLINELTTEEKIGLLTGHQAPVERLGIKERFIGTEYARGWSSHDETQYCTVLPQTIGMASTFDKELINKAGQVCGRESRAYYNSVNKSLIGFGPTVDLEKSSQTAFIANITSEAGSIGACYRINMIDYAMSKAALNMASKTLHNSFKNNPKINILCIHPGWNRTNEGNAKAPLDPYENAETMRILFEERRNKKDGDLFVTWEGKKYPW